MVMLYVLLAVSVALLVLVGSVRITRGTGSQFELKRQARAGNTDAAAVLEREAKLADLLSLQRTVLAFLVIIIALTSVAAYGWLIGVVIALIITLIYGVVSRQPFVGAFAQKYYQKLEPKLLSLTEKAPFVFSLLRSVAVEPAIDPKLTSKEQLLDLVEHSQGILTNDQKALLRHGLAFGSKKVADIMTPRSVIDSVQASELLGPLVLDDLHKTGHSRIPVVEGDIDHVVGILHMRDLLIIDSGKRSSTVRKAMEPRVFYIRDDQTLDHALAAFLKSHHHLFVVVNEYRETVGLLSLEDVIETLLGRKIIDEFDTHDDLRAVAARNPRGNNQPENHTDL